MARPNASIDCERLSAELLRALRGKRSRPGFSRHLGYRSNVAQRWETRACWPTAADFFSICSRLRVDVRAALAGFLRSEPPWLAPERFVLATAVPSLLGELLGRARLTDVARSAGYNRYSVGRWLAGTAAPKLPEFLRVVDAQSRRLLDFVAVFVDPASLAGVSRAWAKLSLSRELAHRHPMTHAVLRALELEGYSPANAGGAAYLARHLGIPIEEVERCLALLLASGQVRQQGSGWVARPSGVVDTGADPARSRALRLGWAKTAIERLEGGAPGYSGYALFAISKHDLRRLREIQLAYARELQAVIAASSSSECVGLYSAQLLDLGVAEDNALAPVPMMPPLARPRGPR